MSKDLLEWNDFIKKTNNKKHRILTELAIHWVKNKNRALDIGGGALNDSRFLINNGFIVDVIDIENIVLNIANELNNKKLNIKISHIENCDIGIEKYNFVIANYVLPFIKKKDIRHVMDNIFNSLKINGIFSGTFFGKNDFYRKNTKIVFNSRRQVLDLLKEYEILYFSEIEKKHLNNNNELKDYHSFEFIVKKNKPLHRIGVSTLIKNNKNEFLLVNLESFEEKFFTVVGGGQDIGESLMETAYREIFEELNIPRENLTFIRESNTPIIFYFRSPLIKENKRYVGSQKFYFGFEFKGEDSIIKVNPGEVRSYKWVAFKDLKDYLLFDNQLSDTEQKIKELFGDIK